MIHKKYPEIMSYFPE